MHASSSRNILPTTTANYSPIKIVYEKRKRKATGWSIPFDEWKIYCIIIAVLPVEDLFRRIDQIISLEMKRKQNIIHSTTAICAKAKALKRNNSHTHTAHTLFLPHCCRKPDWGIPFHYYFLSFYRSLAVHPVLHRFNVSTN